MSIVEVLRLALNLLLWGVGAPVFLGLAWITWVYISDLPSHSEQTEEEEKKMLESLSAGKGLRASETGGNDD